MKNIIARDEVMTNDLYDVIRNVDWAFSGIYEGGSGLGYFGNVIPFDDADIFADVMIGRNAYYSFRDCLQRTLSVKYQDLFEMDRKSFKVLQASLPESAVEEILLRAREARAGIGNTCRAFAACIKQRLHKIMFAGGDGLSLENLIDSWHTLCAEYSSLRHLKSDLDIAAWLTEEQKGRWRKLEKKVHDVILEMRDCFDWNRLTSQRSEGRALLSWPLGTDVEELLLEEVKNLLAQAGSMWHLLRSEMVHEVEEHFHFYHTGEGGLAYESDESEQEPGSGFPRLPTETV